MKRSVIELGNSLGFLIKEIIDAPNDIKRVAIEKRIMKLKEEGENIESLIERAYELMENL